MALQLRVARDADLQRGKKLAEKLLGYWPKFWNPFLVAPNLLAAINRLESIITFGGSSLGRKREELLSYAVSAHNRCHYCAVSHGEFLQTVGKMAADDVIALGKAIRQGEVPDNLSDADRTMLEFAMALTNYPDRFDSESVRTLRDQGFGDQQIAEIIFIVSWFAFCNRVAVGFDIHPETFRSDWGHRILAEVFSK